VCADVQNSKKATTTKKHKERFFSNAISILTMTNSDLGVAMMERSLHQSRQCKTVFKAPKITISLKHFTTKHGSLDLKQEIQIQMQTT
jgi:hypothetical protein